MVGQSALLSAVAGNTLNAVDAELLDLMNGLDYYLGRFQVATLPYGGTTPMLINSDYGLPVANMHPGPNSVGAHETAGTSEAVFVLGRALAVAYRATGSAGLHGKAQWILNAAKYYLYISGQGAQSDTEFWVPNWLYTVKYPVASGASDHFIGYGGGPNDGQAISVSVPQRVNVEGGSNRDMPAAGANAAFDSFHWACEAYWHMFLATGDTTWRTCARATAHTALTAAGDWGTEPLTTGAAYQPGLVPFSCPTLNGAINGNWRGPFYTGYQSPFFAILNQDQAGVDRIYAFWKLAQDDYYGRIGTLGPFSPVYYGNRSDMTSYGAEGTFGWSGPDGNTHWCGFQYRAMEEAAKGWRYLVDQNMAVPADCKTVVERFVNFLYAEVQTNGTVPAQFWSDTAPLSYTSEPHDVALALRAALYAKSALETASMRAKAQYVIGTLYAALKAQKVTDTTYNMHGSFSTDQANHKDFSFHIGEILTTFAVGHMLGINMSTT